ncbi:MAG: hypothetical protein KJ893_04025 [Candidatus Omnitrophica bacterium]|nr:hypothetical protein [Candidatus Omnitrophota bacterium]MBU4478729.1 hypothetical protein [Candidatus Omnitrophota bacterium]MCG2703190.1 hypothetical protein [Candidatus Omnitrophota bacterium]
MKKYFLFFTAVLFYVPDCLIAAPVDLPIGFSQEIRDDNNFSFAIESDYIKKIELKKLDGEIKGTIESIKGVYSAPNSCLDIYVNLGQLKDAEYKFTSGNNVTLIFDDQFTFGAGINSVFNWDEMEEILGASIFFDAKIRRIEDIGYSSVSVNGVSYSEGSFSNTADAKWTEQQLAIGLVKKLKYATIYGGTKYTSARATAKISVAGTTYDLSERNKKDKKFGGFIGVRIPFKNIKIDFEGRFADEKAFNFNIIFNF